MRSKQPIFVLAVLTILAVPSMALAGPIPGDQRVVPIQNQGEALQPLVQRLMQLQDEAKLDQTLAQLVGAGRITSQQAVRIKAQWQRIRSQSYTARLLQIKDETQFQQLLTQWLAEGKITAEQLARIQAQWAARHASGSAGNEAVAPRSRRSAERGAAPARIAQDRGARTLGEATAGFYDLRQLRQIKDEAQLDQLLVSFLAGLQRKHMLVLLIAAALTAPAAWMLMKEEQRDRIESVLNPSVDPRGSGYQPQQSKIAIGSGRFLGKGWKQGTQGQLGFLPARHTDFIFAVLSEERGFLGSGFLLSLFLYVSLRLLRAAREAKDKIGSMVIIGVLSLFGFHAVVNIGMNLGLLPIAGIPLPFVSAGGSSLVSYFAAMSLCMNVNMRRFVN